MWKGRLRVVCVKLNEDFLEVLDRFCKERGYNRSDFIREAVEKYIIEKLGGGVDG